NRAVVFSTQNVKMASVPVRQSVLGIHSNGLGAVCETFVELAHLCIGETSETIGFGALRVESNRLRAIRRGLFEVAVFGAAIPPRAVRFAVRWIKPDGSVTVVDGL